MVAQVRNGGARHNENGPHMTILANGNTQVHNIRKRLITGITHHVHEFLEVDFTVAILIQIKHHL